MNVRKNRLWFCLFIMGFVLVVWGQSQPYASGAENKGDFFIKNQVLAGNLYLRSGNVADALGEFESALKNEPLNPDILIGLIRCHSRLGNFDKAGEYLSKLVKNNPSDMRIHLVSAEYMALKGHTEEAAENFMVLVKKGIYRFEALQGLIQLYASSGNANMKSVFDNAVQLYETHNQLTLYRLAAESLDKNGKHEEALEYHQKYKALSEILFRSDEANYYDEVDPLEYTIRESQKLLDEGKIGKAEEMLAEGTRKWPGEERIQELLKRCYLGALDEIPIREGTIVLTSQGDEPDNKPASGKLSADAISSLIPSDLDDETKVYLNRVLSITAETDNYYNQMTQRLYSLGDNFKIIFASNGCPSKEIAKQFDELKLLTAESKKVSDKEIETLQGVTPSKGMEEVHDLILQISTKRSQILGEINIAIEKRSEAYLDQAFKHIDEGKSLMNQVTPTVQKAIADLRESYAEAESPLGT